MKKHEKQAQTAQMLTPIDAFKHFLNYKDSLTRPQVKDLYDQMRAAIEETTGLTKDIRGLVSDAKRDMNQTRHNTSGTLMTLGIDRIKMILESVPGEMYRFVNEPLVRVK